MKELNSCHTWNRLNIINAKPMTTESLPTKEIDLESKSKIFESARKGNFPTMNLKTGRTGKGEGCPYNCLYCDVGDKNGGYWQETSEDSFKTSITKWADQDGKIIHWCGDREPSTFKWFDTILDLAKEKGFILEIFSNLSGLTPKRAQKLMETKAIVKFKLDSLNPLILGEIMTKTHDEKAIQLGIEHLDKVNMLIQARNQSETKPQLIASIVMSQKNKYQLINILEWCSKFNIVPEIAYMEEIGSVSETGIKALTKQETQKINFWLRAKFGIKDPKQIMGDQCESKAAPIIKGNKVFLGPFGMGCEFPLREHIGELNSIGEYQEDINELKDRIRDFRFSEQNLMAIISELNKIKNKEGIYSKSGTDEILPGCGDDIEELWFLEYTATIFTSDEYFQNFINNWVLKGEHRKWTELEINNLINQIKNLS